MLSNISGLFLSGQLLIDSQSLNSGFGPLPVMLTLGVLKVLIEKDGLLIEELIGFFLEVFAHVLFPNLLFAPILLL